MATQSVSFVQWEEVRQVEKECYEKFFVAADKTAGGWEFSDRSTYEVRYHGLEAEPDLIAIADHGSQVVERGSTWLDLADIGPETLKDRSRRNRRKVGSLRFRYLRHC